MATINPHTTRATGTVLTAAIYNADHENHITNATALNTEHSGFIGDVVDDTTPQLGGPLDTNSKVVKFSKGADVASAAALSLGTDGNAFDITGTTTITSIDTVGIGTWVLLQFDGALTLTHHATDLILPGGANITTAAGDIALFYEYASGDWRCMLYTKAAGLILVDSDIGVTVQGYDVDTLFADTNDVLDAFFEGGNKDDGTQTSGTYIPTAPSGGGKNFTKVTLNGATTFAPPSPSGNNTSFKMVLLVTNGASAASLTTSGWDKFDPNGNYDTTSGNKFVFDITVIDDGGTEYSVCHVTPLQ